MRRRFKIPLAGLIVIIVFMIAIAVVIYKSHLLESWVNRYLANKIAEQYNLDITIGDIQGSLIGEVIFRDVQVQARSDGDTINLAYLPAVRLDYKFSNIWNKRWILDSISFERPRLNLTRTAEGWQLPHLGRRDGGGEPRELPSWEIGKLMIDSAEIQLQLEDRQIELSALTLLASVKSEEQTHTIDLTHLEFYSPRQDVRMVDISGRATVFQKNIVLQDISLKTDSSQFKISGSINRNDDDSQVEILIDDSHIYLDEITRLFDSKLEGDLDVSGRFYSQYGKTGADLAISGYFQGRQFDSLAARFHVSDGIFYFDTLSGQILGGCNIDGYGEMDIKANPRVFNAVLNIDSFDLKHLVTNSFSSDLSGHLIVSGRGLRSDDMIIDLDLQLDESYFDIYHFHSAEGQMSITTDGLYFFPGFRIFYYENRLMFEGDVGYNDDIYLTGRASLADLKRFEGQTFIELPAGRGEAEFTFSGKTSDPDLAGHFVSDSVWFYDFFSSDFTADFDITRFTTRKLGPVQISAFNGEAWQFPYDSITADLTLDSIMLDIDSMRLYNEFSDISAGGQLDFDSYPQVLDLDRFRVDLRGRQFSEQGTQVIKFDSGGFIFDRIDLATTGGFMKINGRMDYDESLDIDWDMANIDVNSWALMLNDSLNLKGLLSSRGSIRGPFTNPTFNLDAIIDSVFYYDLYLGDFSGYLSYRDTVLYLDSTYFESEKGSYMANGTFPIDLSLASVADRFVDREQNINVIALDDRLDLAAFFLESVEYLTGDFTAEITITGTARQPHLNGRFNIAAGQMKLLELQDELKELNVSLLMMDQVINIEKAQAKIYSKNIKKPGLISAGGNIRINDINSFTYNIKARADRIPVNYELGDFKGLVDADLEVTGTEPPVVTGIITVHSATYSEEFTSGESDFGLLAALETDESWNLDLLLDIPSNFWVKNRDINAEFSGQLNITRGQGHYNFLGELEIIRGKYYLIDRAFTFEQGGTINYNDIEEPDPELDLYMTTRVRGQSGYSNFESSSNYSYDLTLYVSGKLSNPAITGAGDTPVSTEDILPILWRGYSDSEANGMDNTSSLTTSLGGILAGQFTRVGSRTLGVETFDLTPGGSGFDAAGTRLTIGAYTLPNLYIYGSSYFDVQRGQEVGLEYRLGRHYIFEGLRDEDELYHLNFKLFWEY